jgi:hypothetical protein
MATATNQTYNTDVYGIVRRINRFIVEIVKSQSSGVSQTISFDVVRAKTYIQAVRSYVLWVCSVPMLDLPETGPTAVDLPAPPVIPMFENESLFDLATLFSLARDEIANSQSSRLSSNLIPFDRTRLEAILDKADGFLNSYVTVIDPIDQPETSPMTAVTGAGARGV